jgi:hypothetical protein
MKQSLNTIIASPTIMTDKVVKHQQLLNRDETTENALSCSVDNYGCPNGTYHITNGHLSGYADKTKSSFYNNNSNFTMISQNNTTSISNSTITNGESTRNDNIFSILNSLLNDIQIGTTIECTLIPKFFNVNDIVCQRYALFPECQKMNKQMNDYYMNRIRNYQNNDNNLIDSFEKESDLFGFKVSFVNKFSSFLIFFFYYYL